MTNDEIRQKAIESARAISQNCSKPCIECEYGEYFYGDIPCLTVNGYEHGFADGVEEGKRQEATWIPVTERLPKTEKWLTSFITTTANGDVIPMQWENTTVRGKSVSRWVWQGKISPWEVIAWMSLPQPFKEGEQE